MKNYINVDLDKLEKGKFNMIASGTGTGKTYFISNELVKRFPANKILFVTSRSAIAEQQEFSINNKGLDLVAKKISAKDGVNVLDSDINTDNNKLNICCYNTLINILLDAKAKEKLLDSIDVVVFDECHTIQIDTFIENIATVKLFIKNELMNQNKYLIGLSATPQPLTQYLTEIGRKVNPLCEYVVNYKADKITFTDEQSLQRLYLDGIKNHKSIVLVDKVDRGLELVDMLRTLNLNAQLLCSRNNKEYNYVMDMTRKYILETEKLPDDLDVLICTSAYREGINIRDEKVQTVISYFGDFLHLTQFMGRLRQDCQDLVIVNNPRLACKSNTKANEYKEKCVKDIKLSQFFANECWRKNIINPFWYKGIQKIVRCNIKDIVLFHTGIDDNAFVKYIIDNYLVPANCDKATMVEKYALTKEKKNDIVAKAIEYKILKGYNSEISFKKVEDWLTAVGFIVVSQQIRHNGKRNQNKYIIEYIGIEDSKEEIEQTIESDNVISEEKLENVIIANANVELTSAEVFVDYVKNNYLMPEGIEKGKIITEYALIDERKQDLINKAKELDILDCYDSKASFIRVENWLINAGFIIEKKRIYNDGKRVQNKFIIEYK